MKSNQENKQKFVIGIYGSNKSTSYRIKLVLTSGLFKYMDNKNKLRKVEKNIFIIYN